MSSSEDESRPSSVENVTQEERIGQCMSCCHQDKVLVEGTQYCSVCLMGIRMGGLRYTCDGCNGVQRISHPMWKYQETPSVKTTATWACHVGCGDYTRWYIHPGDIGKIPKDLIPTSWPQQDDQPEQQQQQQQQERVGQCRSCCHQDKVLVEGTHYCSVCLMGIRMGGLRYTCDGCNRMQRISHPMWKYQQTPTVRTTATWACHVGCMNYTRWFIHPEDIDKIPKDLIPETWPPQEPGSRGG